MIQIRQFDTDRDATDWANSLLKLGYDLHSVSPHTVLRYDKERRRDVAETAIVVTMVRSGRTSEPVQAANALRLAA